MYSDLLDTVRTTSDQQNNLIKGEMFLQYAIMCGSKPTLSLSQVMDSYLVYSIAQNSTEGRFFLDAIRKGHVRISLFGSAGCLQERLLMVLEKAAKRSANTAFQFSVFPFLYTGQYNDRQIRAIYSEISSYVTSGTHRLQSKYLVSSERENIEIYVDAMKKINDAARGRYLCPGTTDKTLKSVLGANVNAKLKYCAEDEELNQLYQYMESELTAKNRDANNRSEYYKILTTNKFSVSKLDEMKTIVDYSYNEVVASSIMDHENTHFNMRRTFEDFAASTAMDKSARLITNESITINDGKPEYMTWGRLNEITENVQAKQKEKTGRTWNEALGIYSRQQSRLPYILGGKGLLIITGMTAATSFISSIVPADIQQSVVTASFAIDLSLSLASSALGEKLGTPTFHDIHRTIKDAGANSKFAKNVLRSISIYSDDENQ